MTNRTFEVLGAYLPAQHHRLNVVQKIINFMHSISITLQDLWIFRGSLFTFNAKTTDYP